MTRHGKWVSRYFVLKGHYLVYHDEKHKESIETRAPKGAVDLDQVQVGLNAARTQRMIDVLSIVGDRDRTLTADPDRGASRIRTI